MQNLLNNNSIMMDSKIKTPRLNKSTFQFNVSISLTALIALLITFYPKGQQTIVAPPVNSIEFFEPFDATSTGMGVNIRSAPTLDSEKVHNKIYKSTILKVKKRSLEKSTIKINEISQTNYWYKVEFIYVENGKKFQGKGWIFGCFIKPVKTIETA